MIKKYINTKINSKFNKKRMIFNEKKVNNKWKLMKDNKFITN